MVQAFSLLAACHVQIFEKKSLLFETNYLNDGSGNGDNFDSLSVHHNTLLNFCAQKLWKCGYQFF